MSAVQPTAKIVGMNLIAVFLIFVKNGIGKESYWGKLRYVSIVVVKYVDNQIGGRGRNKW